jgi:plastocyanin
MAKKGFEDRQARRLCPPTSSARIGVYPGLAWRSVTRRSRSSTKRCSADRGSSKRTLISYLRAAAARFAISRDVIVAILIGPIIGAMLAVAAVAAPDTTGVIAIENFTFMPSELTVAVGTTVKWVNHDDTPHLVVSKDKVFRSKALDTDDSYSFTFTSAGTFEYFCGLHPQMIGKVVVK